MRQVTHENIIWHMHFTCCITKARDAHSEYVTLISFPQRQRLRERASMLCLNAHCLSCLSTTAPQSSVSSFSIRQSSWTNFLGAKILCDADKCSHCTHYGITSLTHEFQKQSCENLNHFYFFLPFCQVLFIYSWVFYRLSQLLILRLYNFQSMGD
jgi:hypothetical protein